MAMLDGILWNFQLRKEEKMGKSRKSTFEIDYITGGNDEIGGTYCGTGYAYLAEAISAECGRRGFGVAPDEITFYADGHWFIPAPGDEAPEESPWQ